MKKPKKRRRKPRNEALVHGHLERVSRRLLEEHFDVVRRFVSRGVGIYALYRKDRLYYVGLAGALSGRLKAHLRDHHKSSWDRFSVYLTMRDQHVKEIESLLLRIARPRGNRVSGRTTSSKDLRGLLQRAVKQHYQQDVKSLFARSSRADKLQGRKAPSTEEQKLVQLFPEGARIRGTNKGAVFRATIRRDGRIGYSGSIYSSLSAAAKVAVAHSINGWWFWQVERGKGHWVRLKKVNRAGMPIYRSR
jgi:hypothetical protein